MPQPTPAIDQGQLEKIVMAGQRVMYDPTTRDYFINGLKKQGNPVDVIAEEIVGLMKMLDDKAKGAIPKGIIIPAAIALMIEAAHFASEAKLFNMDRAQLSECSKKIIIVLLKIYGVLDQIQAKQGGAPAPAAPVSAPPAAPPGLLNQPQAVAQ